MAQEWCDGYLELFRADGSQVHGESTDSQFAKSIELISFEFGSSSGFDDDEAFYRPHDESKTEALVEQRFGASHDPAFDVSSLFGENGAAPEFDPASADQFEGQDLTGIDACRFQIVKQFDCSSPELFAAYCSSHDLGTRAVFETANVQICKLTGISSLNAPNLPYLTLVFGDVVVYSYSLSIADDGFPKETIKMAFGRCRMEYKPQLASGRLGNAVKSGWSFLERDAW